MFLHYSVASILTHSTRGKKIQTIEGLAAQNGTLHPVRVRRRGFNTATPVRLRTSAIMATVGFLQVKSQSHAKLWNWRMAFQGICADACNHEKILTAFMRGAELSGGVNMFQFNESGASAKNGK